MKDPKFDQDYQNKVGLRIQYLQEYMVFKLINNMKMILDWLWKMIGYSRLQAIVVHLYQAGDLKKHTPLISTFFHVGGTFTIW